MDELLAAYKTELTEKHKVHYATHYKNLKPPEFIITTGKKYHKITIIDNSSKSVHCFVDMQGNIYKPAGFAAPAKGIRGRLTDKVKPIFCGDYYIR